MSLREKIEHDLQQSLDSQPDIAAYLNGEKTLEDISNLQTAFDVLASRIMALKNVIFDLADEVERVAPKA
jgi:hypothetical protein